MSEKALWNRLRIASAGLGRFDRVENGVVDGMPDVSYCLNGGIEGWLELKWAYKLPGKRSVKGVFSYLNNHSLLISQRNWMLRHNAAGGTVHILAGSDKNVWLVPFRLCEQFNDMTEADLRPYRSVSLEKVLAILTNTAI